MMEKIISCLLIYI